MFGRKNAVFQNLREHDILVVTPQPLAAHAVTDLRIGQIGHGQIGHGLGPSANPYYGNSLLT